MERIGRRCIISWKKGKMKKVKNGRKNQMMKSKIWKKNVVDVMK